MSQALLILLSFAFAALAAQHIGALAKRLRLPLITGYLVAGAAVGSFFLGWIPMDHVRRLYLVDHTSLAFIAFAAGTELYLKEVRSQLASIIWTTITQTVCTVAAGLAAVLLLAGHIPFLDQLPTAERWAVALMAAAILVARSPSSAIAIINELRARGPFTKTCLGVTVVTDAVVILLFAAAVSGAQSLVGGAAFDPGFLLRVAVDLALSLGVGLLTGRLLQVIVSARAGIPLKAALVLATGAGAFWSCYQIKPLTEHQLSWPLSPEPLLACMIAGFWVTNYTRHRADLDEVLRGVAPLVYIVFFTLVGASLELGALRRLWPVALVLFGSRLLGIFTGTLTGMLLAGARAGHARLGWMAYVTQAGVGLGLAKEVAQEFPSFGGEFSTLIISVIVLNQVVGPPLMKWVLKRVGESHLPATATPDEVRDALILGIDDQSLALARLLTAQGWKVILADTDASHVSRVAGEDARAHHIARVDHASLSGIVSGATDALVAMLGDDEESYRACEVGYERLGIPRLVVRLNDLSNSDRFDALGALVVEPASAMVNLLDQFVRIPQLASMLLHRDPEHEVMQITVADPDVDGLPLRELRLPPSVRVLGISRAGHPIVPQGNTVLHRNDEVTLVGEPEHLKSVVARWGY